MAESHFEDKKLLSDTGATIFESKKVLSPIAATIFEGKKVLSAVAETIKMNINPVSALAESIKNDNENARSQINVNSMTSTAMMLLGFACASLPMFYLTGVRDQMKLFKA